MTVARLATALLAAAVLVAPAAFAQSGYPTKPIELVVPFTAGGGTDLISRLVADYMGKKWSQPILVVNKPGGGGATGARAALKDS
ncbi:MAG: tripartite tricarboxylate transporter substrate binding protein, partial [Candidatus Rokuibacteriota bacterium]